jgi:micrococcal nuclease
VAASKKTISERDFQLLVRKVKRLQRANEGDSADASLRTYWRFGDLILDLRLSSDIGYHNSVLRDLARETGIAVRTLQHSLAFRKTYDKPPPSGDLTWTHFRVLARLPSDKQRTFYSKLARKQGWTSKELQKAIASDLYAGGQLAQPQLQRPTNLAYLYKAEQLRVIDGDTLEVLIDLGFHSFTQQRIRLAQLNAPEITSASGRAARNFLTDLLTDAKTIVLQTHKADLHGRYVAHVFASPRKLSIDDCFAKGKHINDLLVQSKHARVVG